MHLLPKPKKNGSSKQFTDSERSPDSSSQRASTQPPFAPLLASTSLPIDPFEVPCSFEAAPPIEGVEQFAQRVVVLIDGSNLFYAASYLNLEIDYVKLLRCLVSNRRLVRAYFYTGVDRTNEKQQGFLHWMRRNGYRVVAKDLIQFPDGSKKANVQVEIAVDMMTLADHCDTMVLLTGDGTLTYAVNAIAYRGVQIELVSLRSMTSDSLINVADRYTDLDTLKTQIQRS
ncbi:MAG: NYN domain-containing protein [Leptolyngbyaceae cyanobacterium bins.349]|nr:NYN domain-containing protein [Leptolyngbyaceae cyanobacterium bins.349]